MTNRADNIGNTGYIFDADNNLTAVTNVGQVSGVAWAYDAYDRPVSSTDVNGNQIQYRYDPNGNLTNLVYPGNLTVNYYYDNLNRLTNVTDWAGRHTTNTFDLGSELTTVSRPNGTVRAVAYDAAGQTTNIVEHYATGAMAIEYIAQHWNNAAQMDWTFVAPVPHAYSPPSRTMTYDNDNRLESINGTSVTMDNDGNMTYGPGTNGAFVTSTFDVRNRLTSAGGISYGYDPANNRTALTNGSTVEAFVIDPATSQVLMRIKPGVTNYYIYGNGLLYEVDVTATTNTTLYYHYDSRGCTVALTDANGNITDRMEYSAYGMLTYRLGTNDTPFLYNGRYGVQTDLNGLLYMRNRYYNPYICRFLNADPSGFAGGLNMYAFADGNPISEMDPFGLGAVGDDNLRGGTWLAQVAEGLGFDVSLGGDQVTPPTITVEQVARGILGLATGGLYEPALGLVAGQDIDGNPVDRGGAAEQLMQVATVDANIFLALATEGFSAEAEGATGGFVGAGSAETIVTPQGPAIQAVSTEAQTALADVQGGATVYRQGWTGFQRTSDAQFWAFQNPATTPNYAGQLGMPAASTQGEYFWMMGGRVPSGTSVITRPAPGIGANAGGSMEAVVNPGGVRVDWFHMP
jgi:RHS repeat-associated protein